MIGRLAPAWVWLSARLWRVHCDLGSVGALWDMHRLSGGQWDALYRYTTTKKEQGAGKGGWLGVFTFLLRRWRPDQWHR